jgi:hypothetical protein
MALVFSRGERIIPLREPTSCPPFSSHLLIPVTPQAAFSMGVWVVVAGD